MLISRVPEEGAGEGREVPAQDNSHEYNTASELFELIAKNTFSRNNDPLTKSDLVILYKNIDLGSRLMTETNVLNRTTRPNQRVETIVHSGDDPDSDTSEVDDATSSYDLAPTDIYLINKERLDLLNNPPSLENTLCQKFGDLEIKMSNLRTDILFKRTTVKEQLDNLLSASCNSSCNDLNSTVLPSSLLDYICCKRLEDNYNFYMENIIRYVKHTIDQLKRISNGDYLTEKARDKWREIAEDRENTDSNKKILAASTSIPLPVERKITGRSITWDDIVHSEMDIRSLSKILEKKIFLEIPKIICGSYRLFSKQCADNLIISCEKKAQAKMIDKKDSRVDVVLKLKRSQSGQVVSNINSIMILQAPASPSLTHGPILALPANNGDQKWKEQKIIELSNESDEANKTIETAYVEEAVSEDEEGINEDKEAVKDKVVKEDAVVKDSEAVKEGSDAVIKDKDRVKDYEEALASNYIRGIHACDEYNQQGKSDTSIPLGDVYSARSSHNYYQEAAFATVPDELSLSMQRLDIQTSLPEESIEDIQEYQTKKRSPTRVRIKSPYENKSHLIDEKKRKRLLEIRERREKKKIALSESCKVMKHRHGKGTLTPQASSSVTKLSITNKSFYNSIYGQAGSIDSKQKSKSRKFRKDGNDNMCDDQIDMSADVAIQSPIVKRQYVNKTYYLDDAVTEMMYMDMKKEANGLSSNSSAITADLGVNLSLLQSVTDFNDDNGTETSKIFARAAGEIADTVTSCQEKDDREHMNVKKSNHDLVPANSPNRQSSSEKQGIPETVSTLECRKSIEKLYGLLKKAAKFESVPKVCSPANFTSDLTTFRESSTAQASDSGTSLKHHLTCSETSGFSFNKPNNVSTMYEATSKQMQNRATEVTTSVIPKVIISTKCQTAKLESEKHKRDHKKVGFAAPKVIPDNPLKAISQLLHEFDNAQKSRHKSSEDRPVKAAKKYESNLGGDRNVRQSLLRGRSRLDQHLKTTDPGTSKNVAATRRQPAPTEPTRLLPHDKHYDKAAKKKLSEIIDEVKEARGEAVRGPPITSRLNTLAQPKKSYVQAHSEDYQSRYGRNLMSDRLQRLAAAQAERHATVARKQRRASELCVPKPPPPPTIVIECQGNARRSLSSSPVSKRSPDSKRSRDTKGKRPDVPAKHSHVPDVPGTFKEKMVAVETYVKSHYGRPGSASPGDHRIPKKSRVPLLPSDIDLASMTSSPPNEESTAIGSELHNIIDTMIKKAPALSALSEGLDEVSTDEVYVEELSKNEDRLLPFEYDLSDIFKDNIHTAVEDYQSKNVTAECADDKQNYELRQYSSSTELRRLENALYRQMSIGNFQKRLRIKNLTITPKHSMQHVMVVQSGDVGSVVLKTSLSQSFDLKSCSFTNMVELKKSISILTNPNMAWTHTSIPMQISTVGYAFPEYEAAKKFSEIKSAMISSIGTNDKEKRKETQGDENIKSCLTKEYTSQTFKGQLSNKTLQCNCSKMQETSSNEQKSDLTKFLFSDNKKDLIDKYENRDNSTEDKEKLNEDGASILLAAHKSNKDINVEKSNQEDVEYSTSLDMLVGLLNEIQKITQTQTEVLNISENKQCQRLENILNNAATLENNVIGDPEELITISALDKSRTLDSSPSSYSFYITKSEERSLSVHKVEACDAVVKKPLYVDKEVSVEIIDREYRNTFTDVPSSIFPFPITINTSTSVTNSLMELLSESSTQSLFSCKDILYSDTIVNSQNKILELNYEPDHIVPPVVAHDEIDKAMTQINDSPKLKVTVTLEPVVEEVETLEIRRKSKQVRKIGFRSKNVDPLMKMKRDILVTVYSVLVLTVFAALSFPEVLYRA